MDESEKILFYKVVGNWQNYMLFKFHDFWLSILGDMVDQRQGTTNLVSGMVVLETGILKWVEASIWHRYGPN